MADPNPLSTTEYLVNIAQGIVGGLLAGITTFWALFSGSKKELSKQMQDLDDKMDEHAQQDEKRHTDHAIVLSSLTIRQQYADELLEKVEASIKESATHGADKVTEKFEVFMNEIRELRRMHK